MRLPAVDDTIIAVSTGWSASPLAVVRLSGPGAGAIVEAAGVSPRPPAGNRTPCWTQVRVPIEPDLWLPATAYWFREPRSYTGQDLVELHTVGCLPLLRELCTRLIRCGARRALPGEFTARAYLNGKLRPDQVENVLALIKASTEADARTAGRHFRASAEARLETLRQRVEELLAHVEAAIDFVDQEDVRFIEPRELRAEIDELLALAAALRSDEPGQRRGKPHVALAGLPNAGKSTLFNALLGSERAIVSPVLGTTRDVLAAEVEMEGTSVVLQDCAGLGDSPDELALASYVAAERAAEQADVVLWLHPAGSPWTPRELEVLSRLPRDRVMVVMSKTDLGNLDDGKVPAGVSPPSAAVSASTGAGIELLREALMRRVSSVRAHETQWEGMEAAELAMCSLERAGRLADPDATELSSPELIGFELRAACEALETAGNAWSPERVLARIFSQFCVGK